MVPPVPTANTSPESPQTALRSELVPLGSALQAVPSKRKMAPPLPTANTSLAELPQTPCSASVAGAVNLEKFPLSECLMRPQVEPEIAQPTIQTSPADEPHAP